MSRRKRLSMRCATVALLLGLQLTSSGAADLDALMREFKVSATGLKPAPGFSLETIDGRTVALTDQRGRAVLLYFWATW